jgi:hypothetical protein
MLNKIVTEDNSWVHHYQPKSNGVLMRIETSPFIFNQKFKVTPSAGKVMLTVFGDSQGVLLAHFQKYGENVNSVGASGGNSQKTSRPADKRCYCFIMTMPTPTQPEQLR